MAIEQGDFIQGIALQSVMVEDINLSKDGGYIIKVSVTQSDRDGIAELLRHGSRIYTIIFVDPQLKEDEEQS